MGMANAEKKKEAKWKDAGQKGFDRSGLDGAPMFKIGGGLGGQLSGASGGRVCRRGAAKAPKDALRHPTLYLHPQTFEVRGLRNLAPPNPDFTLDSNNLPHHLEHQHMAKAATGRH